MRNINVFVYGTLLSGSCNPAERMVDAEVVGPATAHGQIYDLGWFPGFKRQSTVEGDSLVKGEVIRIDEEGLERLDAYEGVPSLYSRGEITAITDDGEAIPAYVYIYNGNVHEDDLIPHGDFIRHEAEGQGDN